MHAGAEGRTISTRASRGRSTFLGETARQRASRSRTRSSDAGADLVVGHGPHVLRGIEWYRGRVIAYSLGNFLGNGTLERVGRLGADGGASSVAAPRRLLGRGEARAGPADGRRPAARRLEPGGALDGAQALARRLPAERRPHLAVRDAAAARLAHRLIRRNDLPTGTVTFLFTDVEGSTTLLHELGAEGYAEALAQHRRLIREACASHDGVEVDTQGDALFYAFPTAPGALRGGLSR